MMDSTYNWIISNVISNLIKVEESYFQLVCNMEDNYNSMANLNYFQIFQKGILIYGIKKKKIDQGTVSIINI